MFVWVFLEFRSFLLFQLRLDSSCRHCFVMLVVATHLHIFLS